MTLAYSVVHQDCVQILSDAAIYLPDGTLVDFKQKVFTSPSVPLAVISIGSSEMGDIISEAIIEVSAIGSFDVAILIIEEIIHRLEGHVPDGHDFSLILSGISESRGPCHFFATTKVNDKTPAYSLFQLSTPEFGNMVGTSAEELAAIGFTPAVAQALGPDFLRQYGVALAEVMRRKKTTNWMAPDRPALHIIGGFLQLTTITAEGCATETLTTWPEDQIGQKINPFGQVVEAA